jgi:origin recognition complex subunit 1
LLEDLFSSSGRLAKCQLTVVLLDELDMLLSRDQSVLYNLFGWPQASGARLVVIGIANTLDLPERLLPKIARCVDVGVGLDVIASRMLSACAW